MGKARHEADRWQRLAGWLCCSAVAMMTTPSRVPEQSLNFDLRLKGKRPIKSVSQVLPLRMRWLP